MDLARERALGKMKMPFLWGRLLALDHSLRAVRAELQGKALSMTSWLANSFWDQESHRTDRSVSMICN